MGHQKKFPENNNDNLKENINNKDKLDKAHDDLKEYFDDLNNDKT